MKLKTRNWWQWTEARYKSFIISALRGISRWWGPKNQCKKNARIWRWKYKCEICWKTFWTKEIVIDHILPIINPKIWFVDFNVWIEKCFIEVEWFQAICKECHIKKTNKEKSIAKKRRSLEKKTLKK
jgi:5-methylcytosine-specific restriction endonuclease McrA